MDTYHIKYLQRVDSCKNVVEEDRVLIDSHKSEYPGEAKQRQQNHRHFYTASGREKEKKRHYHIAGYFPQQRALSLVASRSHDILQ